MFVVLVLGILFAASTIALAHHQDGHAQGGGNHGNTDPASNNSNGNSAGGNGNSAGGNGNSAGGNGNNGHSGPPQMNNRQDESDASDSHNDDNEKRKAPSQQRLQDPERVEPLPETIDEAVDVDEAIGETIDEAVDDAAGEIIEEAIDEAVGETIDEAVDEAIDEEAATDSGINPGIDEDPELPSTEPQLPVANIEELPLNDDTPVKDDEPTTTQDGPAQEEGPKASEPAHPAPEQPVTEKELVPEPEIDPRPESDPAPLELEPLPFTFWVEGFVVFVLADPIFFGDDLVTSGTYEWDWGDGTVSRGDFFQTHQYDDGPAIYSVQLIRYGPDGDPTHEYTLEIDLTDYVYDDPRHIFENTKPVKTASVAHVRPTPVVESDVGQLIATVPVGPMPLFLLTALALLAGVRKRLGA